MSATNPPASVRGRLRNLAERDRVDFGSILTRYALERMLYRLSVGERAVALSTGSSHRVDDTGFRMVLNERTLTQALKQLRSGAAAPRLAEVAAFELSLRRRLGPTIEPAPDDRSATFGGVVQYWDPDFIIAVDARVVARFEDDRAVFRPLAWVRNCIAVIR